MQSTESEKRCLTGVVHPLVHLLASPLAKLRKRKVKRRLLLKSTRNHSISKYQTRHSQTPTSRLGQKYRYQHIHHRDQTRHRQTLTTRLGQKYLYHHINRHNPVFACKQLFLIRTKIKLPVKYEKAKTL